MLLQPTESLEKFLAQGPYQGYCYSYPHKTAYRVFEEPESLEAVWSKERAEAIFLYVHLPFCEFRCGFCNLFTLSQPADDLPTRYLQTLRRQAGVIRESIPDARFSQVAIGGGTPTFLHTSQLAELFDILQKTLAIDLTEIPVSIEASPATIDPAKLALLSSQSVDRVSIGIQSFNDKDVGAMGRPQKQDDAAKALDAIRQHQIPTLNLDLIYGAAGQTLPSWLDSVGRTLDYSPEEIYLYPLYVRPLTGLSNQRQSQTETASQTDFRLTCYRAARDKLLDSGYRQVSMRMFEKREVRAELDVAKRNATPQYRCQEDGMVGLGCGARSYTRQLHYSSRFAVSQSIIGQRIEDYIQQSNAQLAAVGHGIELDADEQRRRYVIMSLLLVAGLNRQDFARRFAADAIDYFPNLNRLAESGLATIDDQSVRLTASGLEQSDAIGPWLYSDSVRSLIQNYSWQDA